MAFRKLYVTISVLVMALLCSCKSDEANMAFAGEVVSFNVFAEDKVIEAQIDNEKGVITIPGITDGMLINKVEYEVTDGSVVYPDPSTFVGGWGASMRFALKKETASKCYTVVLPDCIGNEGGDEYDAVINPDDKFGVVTEHFFFDIKDGSQVTAEKAAKFYQEEGMDGIRIPIYGIVKDGVVVGHTGPGQVVASDYTKVINSVQQARKYNSNLMIFASKKLNAKESFAPWLKDGNVLNAERYAGMLLDFLKFMKQNDIEVDVLGIDNETNFNEGGITPDKYIQVVKSLKQKITAENLKMPRFIGPERYNPQDYVSGNWLYNLFNKADDPSNIDIYGTHYYPHHHIYSMNKCLVNEYNACAAKNMEFWATEPHWDNDDVAASDVLGHARMAMCTFWDQTDLGMSAFMWWGYPLEDTSVRGSLMHDMSVAVHGAQPIRVVDHDGEATMGTKDYNGKWTDWRQKPNNDSVFDSNLHTRAFIKNGNEVHLFIINVRYLTDVKAGKGESYTGYKFSIKNHQIDGDISCRQWDDEHAAGVKRTMKADSDDTIVMDIPLRTITHLTFKIK